MKITPLMPSLHRNQSFKSSAGGTINPHYRPRYENTGNENENPHPSHGCLRSLGNGLYWGLVLNTIILTPIAKHNLDKAWQEKMAYENTINKDYYELSDKLHKKEGISNAYFNVNKLHDVDDAMIIKTSPTDYIASFNLDNKSVNMHMNISEENKDSLSGVMTIKEKHDNDSVMWVNDYSIKFSTEKVGDFILKLKSRAEDADEKTLTMTRQGNSLYLIENGKKTLLNGENLAKYEEKQLQEEEEREMYESSCRTNRITIFVLALLTLIKMRNEQNRRPDQT